MTHLEPHNPPDDASIHQTRLRALADHEVRQVPLPPGCVLFCYEYGGGYITPNPGYAIEVLDTINRVGRTHVVPWPDLAAGWDVKAELQLIIHELQLAHLRTNTTSSAMTTNASNSQNRNDTATTT